MVYVLRALNTSQNVQTIVDNYDVNAKALHLFLYSGPGGGGQAGVYTSTMSVHFRKRERPTRRRSWCRLIRPASTASARASAS